MTQGIINRLEASQKDLFNWLTENRDLQDTEQWDEKIEQYANNAETLRILKGEPNPPKKED